jgi:NarL family two-component system response regulator LiaR
MTDQIRILIADDHTIVRDGLKALLNSEPGMQVVGEAVDGFEAIQLADTVEPDIILLDLMMPRVDGVQATAEIKRKNPHARILILTSFAENNQVFSAIKAGAMGYLLKDTSAEELIRIIHDAFRDRPILQPTIARKLMLDIQEQSNQERGKNKLTEREIEILRLVAEGKSNQEIADDLVLSERTVRTHITNILAKLRLDNRTQAALYALRKGIAQIRYTPDKDVQAED